MSRGISPRAGAKKPARINSWRVPVCGIGATKRLLNFLWPGSGAGTWKCVEGLP